jgi:hypothetical protein
VPYFDAPENSGVARGRVPGCAAGVGFASPASIRSGTTCWQKRAFYQARNPGLKETLGSGTRYSAPCVLDAYLAIEQAAVEFGVEHFIDTMIRIAACESLLQPAIVGYADPFDVGLFQWNDRPPWRWWTSARKAFNASQDRLARASGGRYTPRYASNVRTDPYNSARVAAWQIRTFPRSWAQTWHCKGRYDPKAGRLR